MKHAEIIERLRQLYSGVISDSLDKIGIRDSVMRHDIRPLYPEAVVVGSAFTVLTSNVYHFPKEPYKMEIESIDKVQPGNVIVSTCDSSPLSSYWGELIATCCKSKGALGAVIDGFTRDTKRLITMQFPTFVRGIHPADTLGRNEVIAYNVPIKCGGVIVRPGDIVFGDIDGVAVIPKERVIEVLELAEAKTSKEDETRMALENGEGLAQVFARIGVL